MRKLSIIVVPLLIIGAIGLALFGFNRLRGAGTKYAAPAEGKVHVVTTMYPLGDFAKNIGGDFVHVTVATPVGVEPHDFEPTPRQVAFMLQADVFVMNGGGVDAWAEDIASQIRQRGGEVVNMEEVISFEATEAETDPHIWLDPQLAQDMVRYIRYAIIEKDETHRDEYLSMTDAYLTELLDLHTSYENGLRECELRDIIVTHDAFGYIGRRYNVTIHSILGISPEEEPSAKKIAELADKARELQVKTIFFETLVSPKLAKTLAKEIDAETAVLNPVENLTLAESLKKEDYLTLMEANLSSLRKGLLCQ